jgi:hypothetical protein
MKKTKILLSLVMFLLMTTFALGVSNMTGKWQDSRMALIYDATTTIDANSLQMFVYNNGNFAYDNANVGPAGKTDGLYYPRGTKKTAIYAAGLWIGAKVNNQVRIAMAEYSSEFVPGPMKNGTYQPDKAAFKVYKVKRGDNAGNNPDYRDWPKDQGAPVDSLGNPAILGDQFLWSACNDADPAKHTNNSASTAPLGIEVQQSTFAYARGGALGNTIFMKFKFINKGPNRLDSTYVSLWADPDLGGCDTALSLGYCYNSGVDQTYGAAPPSVGFDFFQGPIVPGEPTDSAFSFGKWHYGKKKLGMTAFSKYINGEDPQAASEVYLFMKGYRKLSGQMVPAVDPNGDTTTFVFAGDPQTQVGWLDILPDDRRFMMTSGPFTMAPGDSQEVVAAVIIGQGTDPLSSIGALKLVDQQVQAVFELNFDIPNPPPSPTIWGRGDKGRIDVSWGSEPVGDVQISEKLKQEFHFEGFNLYQGESAVGPWHKFATYDDITTHIIVDSLTNPDVPETTFVESPNLIYVEEVNPAAGGIQSVIVQKGSNSGLTFHTSLTNSQIDGSVLNDNVPYYFAVTAYSFDIKHITPVYNQGGILLGDLTETLESPFVSVEIRPHTVVGQLSPTMDHVAGESEGEVYVEYLEPENVTGDKYEVTINEDLSFNLLRTEHDGSVVFDTLLKDQTNLEDNFDRPVFDGLMFRVVGPPPGVSAWEWEDVDGKATRRWFTGTDFGGSFFGGGLFSGWDWGWGTTVGSADYVNIEIRFSKTETQKAYDYLRGGSTNYGYVGYFDCPFTIWDMESNPPRQLNAAFAEQNGVYTYDSTWFPGKNGGDSREYLFILKSTYSAELDTFYSNRNIRFDAADMPIMYILTPQLVANIDSDTAFMDGQKLKITRSKPLLPEDRYVHASKKVGDANGALISMSLDDVKTVPNPYYSFYQEEVDQFDRIVKFINLPPVPLKIRIFNIAGDLVRTMERTDIYDAEFVWDLKTDQGLWVASGVYVWLIEGEGVGTKYGKMAIFTEIEQLNVF